MIGPAVASGQMRYILVVDSEWNERFTLSMLLQRFGYTIASTNNAQEGIEYLCVAPAVAVFAETGDVGTDLAARLKADKRFQDVPLVMVADKPDKGFEDRLRHGEIAGLIRKPVKPDEVFQVVQKVIEQGSRRNIRIPTALQAELRDGSGVNRGFATVLSQYGMFFRTLNQLPGKSQVEVGLTIGDRTLNIGAEVLYNVSFEEGPFCEPGMGMKFVNIAPEDSALIKFFIYEQLGAGIIPPEPGSGVGQA